PRAQSVLRALPLLPRGVLVDVLRDRAWQITTTGATLPSGGSTRTPLRPVIEHEELRMGMVVKRMNQRQAGFYLHHARILDVLMAVGADELFSLHAAHHHSIEEQASAGGGCSVAALSPGGVNPLLELQIIASTGQANIRSPVPT